MIAQLGNLAAMPAKRTQKKRSARRLAARWQGKWRGGVPVLGTLVTLPCASLGSVVTSIVTTEYRTLEYAMPVLSPSSQALSPASAPSASGAPGTSGEGSAGGAEGGGAPPSGTPGRGRPRAFDRTVALDRAMEVFWVHGYEGATLARLTTAMGIAPPSLYHAFGPKEALFAEALQRYGATEGARTRDALQQAATLPEAVWAVLREAAGRFPRGPRPGGCMVSLAAVTCGEEHAHAIAEAARLRREILAALEARFQRAVVEGESLPAGVVSPAALARYVEALLQGMSVQARDGVGEEGLLDIARLGAAALGIRPAE